MRFVRTCEKRKTNFASFRLEFFASDQSKINRAYFRFVLLPKIFCFASFSFCFRFISFSFHFKCKNKRKNTFRIEAKKLCFRFASFRFEAKMIAVFRFRFASFRFEAKMMAFFHFFFILFSLRFIFVSLQISMFRIDAKQAKKHFFRIKATKNSLPFGFISLRSENDFAP
jgi:hypothetical protein